MEDKNYILEGMETSIQHKCEELAYSNVIFITSEKNYDPKCEELEAATDDLYVDISSDHPVSYYYGKMKKLKDFYNKAKSDALRNLDYLDGDYDKAIIALETMDSYKEGIDLLYDHIIGLMS